MAESEPSARSRPTRPLTRPPRARKRSRLRRHPRAPPELRDRACRDVRRTVASVPGAAARRDHGQAHRAVRSARASKCSASCSAIRIGARRRRSCAAAVGWYEDAWLSRIRHGEPTSSVTTSRGHTAISPVPRARRSDQPRGGRRCARRRGAPPISGGAPGDHGHQHQHHEAADQRPDASRSSPRRAEADHEFRTTRRSWSARSTMIRSRAPVHPRHEKELGGTKRAITSVFHARPWRSVSPSRRPRSLTVVRGSRRRGRRWTSAARTSAARGTRVHHGERRERRRAEARRDDRARDHSVTG